MENSETLDFGELSGDSAFKERVENFQTSIKNVEKIIDTILEKDVYNNLSNEDKVRYDLFLSFTINSLYWYYMRTQGKDPSQHDLKNEINRVKEYMTKSKKIYERKHVMPRIDQGAAGRFIRSGLFDPKNAEAKTIPETEGSNPNKRKREDSASD